MRPDPGRDIRGLEMNATAARWIVWGGGATLAAAAVATVLATVLYGDEVFAARLIAGLGGCL